VIADVERAPARPFPGPDPFSFDDRAVFFGREPETTDAVRRLVVFRGVLLFGDRVGKTSLIHAGIVPAALKEGLAPELIRFAPFPGEEIVVERIRSGQGYLPSVLTSAPGPLARMSADDLLEAIDRSEQTPLLIFDHLEQAVDALDSSVPGRPGRERRRVRERLLELITQLQEPDRAVKLLFSFRESSLAGVLKLLPLHPEVSDQQLRLQPFASDALTELVKGPFARFPGRYEPEFSDAEIDEVVRGLRERDSRGEVDLMTLQSVCAGLWGERDRQAHLRALRQAGVLGRPEPVTPAAPETIVIRRSAGLTTPERWLYRLLVTHAIWSALLAIGYLIDGDTRSFAALPNSFAKDVLFVVLSVAGAAEVRRFGGLALVIAVGYLALVVGQITALAWGGVSPVEVPLIAEVSGTVALLGWMVADIALAVAFGVLWLAATRARYGLRYLDPISYLSLSALAEVLIEGRREVIPPDQVAANVDGYLADLESRGKSRVRLALVVLSLWPLVTFRPPLNLLGPDIRKRFLERRFVADVAERRAFAPLRRYLQVLIRTASQMAYLGYYGDRRSWSSIGYTPYQHRIGGRPPSPGDHRQPPLRSLMVPPRRRYDAVVVGSGAAGSILAYRLAESGRRVLVLERGPHVDPREFTDDEVSQYLRLYNEGALQLATDFGLQVLQGMCVGGGTTINNALCLPPPEPVLAAWEPRGLDRAGLLLAIDEVRRWLDVSPIRSATTTVAAHRFQQAVRELDLPGRLEVMEANISSACRGCGYCNIGCAYGAKLSTLDSVLPWAQERFELDVLADVEVERIVCIGDRATLVTGVHRATSEHVAIEADEIVVAAGAIGSSWLLQRSGLGGDAVGRGLHFNINSPLTADFPDVVDSFAGIQMSHAYRPPGEVPDYLLETWFNPPATQALAMPGWFDRHFHNMQRYRHMASSGVLVGTTTPGRGPPGRDGPLIEYTASAEDRARILEGLQVAGRIWLQAGAERVMPATFAWHEYRSAEALSSLPRAVGESGDLLMTSAHPQGGNALGEVVDEDFRVRGLANLYLCDASVFPTSVHVNPQLTVMGMAQYAAQRILAGDRALVA
jgi:choline dehydrogenase-like flavoprotein